MKVLVIGSGGREHALAWKFSQDRDQPELFCAPGNAGTATFCRNVAIKADDIQGLCEWARTNRPDLVVVGPEVPLCAGIADRLQVLGVAVFGPRQDAARLEGSKIFSKDVMESAGVPTARSCRFRDSRSALDYLKTLPPRVVVKADGLAAGKGVVVAERHAEAEQAIHDMLDSRLFGDAGTEILVEEFLEGEEASILALVDGNRAVLLPASQDHKRVGDGDTGPNTGGMGAYSPAPVVTPALRPLIEEQVFNPMLRELSRRGIRYQGVLYAGLMIGPQGIKVLEFNCRFGDPETQAVLPRL
ncbi:MAG: phosphoribosylamine--glycine ligase, partial [Lentisphaerae bacterium RIFOXYB12_FULL_60_10]